MRFFYSAGVMKYGNGYFWHKFYNFPKLTYITKTLTLEKRRGNPLAISYIPFRKSIWNKVGLSNMGFYKFLCKYRFFHENGIMSIAGTDDEIEEMIGFLEHVYHEWNSIPFIKGIELNFSCPNVKSYNNKRIPKSSFPLFLKLNYKMDPYVFDLSNIIEIRLNSIPTSYGGISGKIAQKYNWSFIEKFTKEGLKIAGCSAVEGNDFIRLRNLGCTSIGLGSIILLKPETVENIELWSIL
jgi:dihydroorotate dehydrogenase